MRNVKIHFLYLLQCTSNSLNQNASPRHHRALSTSARLICAWSQESLWSLNLGNLSLTSKRQKRRLTWKGFVFSVSGEDFIQHNQRFLCRIYPAGSRTSSSNYNPQEFWNVGCQLGEREKREEKELPYLEWTSLSLYKCLISQHSCKSKLTHTVHAVWHHCSEDVCQHSPYFDSC